MFDVLTQMAALIVCGLAWRLWRPMGIDADTCRLSLSSLVYVLLLPALVLQVLWKAKLGLDSSRIALTSGSSTLISLGLAWLIYHISRTKKSIAGALILAAAFPNATYMGLPVLEQLLGSWARPIAIQYDLFASTPLLLTVGILLASHYGHSSKSANLFKELLKVPPLWAAVIAVTFNLSGVPLPEWLDHWLGMLAVGVIPLMLISLGMSLKWSAWQNSYTTLLLPVIAIQLIVMPFIGYNIAQWSGLTGATLTAVLLEAAMPSMVLGMVLCDRFKLNTSLYAVAVTVTTGLSFFTLPLWFNWIS
jgi:predicted permease